MAECEFCGDEAPDPVEDRGGYVFCSVRHAREFDAQVAWEANPGAVPGPTTEESDG